MLKKNGLNWIEDHSNTKILFSRTKIRLAISKNDKIRNNIKNELDICQNIYKDYVEMINFILCKVIIFISGVIVIFCTILGIKNWKFSI